MKCAYSVSYLENLWLTKEARRWHKSGYISKESFDKIASEHQAPFYHPNLMIRILLFMATMLALGGVTGILGLLFSGIAEDTWAILCLIYGIASFVVLEKTFIANHHYKSGVNEAIIYHACGFTIIGAAGLADFDSVPLTTCTCFLVFNFAAIRYLDLICTTGAALSFAFGIFDGLYKMGELVQPFIPFAFIFLFGGLFWLVRIYRSNDQLRVWNNSMILLEAICLLLAYAGGNYLVVRELSIELLSLQLLPDEDIPFAFLFYGLTILIPVSYLYFGIKIKDIVLIRVSLFVIAFSVFTFKYYYSFGHPEITLTLAGAILLGVALWLMNYLKSMRNGFTRDNLLSEKWASANVQAFAISQTMGGNVASPTDAPGGGASGGGGSSDSF